MHPASGVGHHAPTNRAADASTKQHFSGLSIQSDQITVQLPRQNDIGGRGCYGPDEGELCFMSPTRNLDTIRDDLGYQDDRWIGRHRRDIGHNRGVAGVETVDTPHLAVLIDHRTRVVVRTHRRG